MPEINTTVYVELDEFDTDDLIDELKGRKLSERQKTLLANLLCDMGADEPAISRSVYELVAGRKDEALVWLERALPREWRGRLAP